MSEEQLRRLLDALYLFAHDVEGASDMWNLGARMLSVAGGAITEQPSRDWFRDWREGRPWAQHLAPSEIHENAPEVEGLWLPTGDDDDEGGEDDEH